MALPDRDIPVVALPDGPRRAALIEVAASRHQSPADLLNDAVDAYLESDSRQRAEIEAALADAKAGDFADPDEVAAAFRPR